MDKKGSKTVYVKKYGIFNIVSILLCFFGVIALKTFAAPCERGMICVKTTSACMVLLLIIAGLRAVSMASIFTYKREKELRVANNVVMFTVQFLLGTVGTLMINGAFPGMGVCRVETMRCATMTRPFLSGCLFPMLIVIAMINIIYNVIMLVRERNGNEDT